MLGVHDEQRAGDAVPHGAGLAAHPAAEDLGYDIEAAFQLQLLEWFQDMLHQGVTAGDTRGLGGH